VVGSGGDHGGKRTTETGSAEDGSIAWRERNGISLQRLKKHGVENGGAFWYRTAPRQWFLCWRVLLAALVYGALRHRMAGGGI